MTNSNYKLTKEDFKQINKRSLFTFQLGWNYERMQGSGYLYMLLPQLRKMYGDGTPELKEMMKLHTQFFNTSPFFHTIIAGFDLAMEEKDGVKSKDAVNGIKTGLMGPFAPLGDSIFGSLVPAIMGSIAATMAIAGQPWGILLWIAVAVAKEAKVAALIQLSQDVLERVADVQQLVDLDFSRIIYLGAGPFFGLAHEAQLKILELTAGQIATMYESPVGFRHGPKSLINQDTVVLVFGSTDGYTKAYDLDLVREVAGDGIVRRLVMLTDREEQLEGVEQVVLSTQEPLGDSYRIFPYIVYAQLFALLSSLKVKNRPDTPSPTGTVNRVVQGVIIHSLGQ